MQKNNIFSLAIIALLISLFSVGCKKNETITPVAPVADFVEFSIDGAAPIKYEDKVIGSNAFETGGYRSSNMAQMVGAKTNTTNNKIEEIAGVQLENLVGRFQPLAKNYTYSNTPNHDLGFIWSVEKTVGTDVITEAYGKFLDAASPNSFIKIDIINFQQTGVARGSFYIENADKLIKTNGGASQVVSSNHKIRGSFQVTFVD